MFKYMSWYAISIYIFIYTYIHIFIYNIYIYQFFIYIYIYIYIYVKCLGFARTRTDDRQRIIIIIIIIIRTKPLLKIFNECRSLTGWWELNYIHMLYIYVVYLHIMFLSLDVRRWNIYSPSLQDPIPRLPWPLGVLPSAQLVPELSYDMYIYM